MGHIQFSRFVILKVEIKFPKCGVLSDFYLGKEITSRILTKRKGVFGFQLTLKKDDFDLELKPTLELISFAKNLPITERVNRIRVTNSSESETALFPAKKVQNPPPIFPIKKLMHVIFIAFLCDNLSHTLSKRLKIF